MKSLNNIRLRNKLLLLYFLSVFLPILFTNVFFYAVTTYNVRSQREQDISLSLDLIQNGFRSTIDTAVGISSVFNADGMINDTLETEYKTLVDYLDVYDAYIRPSISKYVPVDKSIQAITIYTDNPTVLGAGGISMITDEVKRSDWYGKIMSAQANAPVLVHSKNGGTGVFSIIRKLNVFSGRNSYLKILKIDLHQDAVKLALDSSAFQGKLYLVSAAGDIEYTTESGIDWRHKTISFDSVVKQEGKLVFVKDFPNIDYLRGWSVIGLLPEHQVLADMQKSRTAVVYLACANLLLPTLIIVWITKSLHDRLLRIVKHMKKVKNQHFELIPHGESTDEIGQLTVEFNRMTQQIKRLIDDVYLADIQKKDLELQRRQAQLHALQSQINPHFLFNALEALRMRSLLKQEDETAKIISSMAKIFRKSLAWGNDQVTVRQEMDLIVSFLEIQKYRFGEKLQYRITVEEPAADCKIPKMIFLPFVENACMHGIEAIQGQGLIELRIAIDLESLVFCLRDNGIGMDEQKLRELMSYRRTEEDPEEHIGIRNVSARLHLYYGEAARLEIDSEPGAGTTVRIHLPKQLNFLE